MQKKETNITFEFFCKDLINSNKQEVRFLYEKNIMTFGDIQKQILIQLIPTNY